MENINLTHEIQERIKLLSRQKDYLIIAIDGNSGAGKSTLAEQLSHIYDCNVFHMDHFFLTPELRTEERLNEAGGNVDYMRFNKEVAEGLKSRKEFCYRTYNCQTGFFEETVTVMPKKINIVEGVYSMHPTLIDMYDLKIFLSLEKEEQSRRILQRSGAKLHKRFLDTWIPLENLYFNTFKIREQCDLVY